MISSSCCLHRRQQGLPRLFCIASEDLPLEEGAAFPVPSPLLQISLTTFTSSQRHPSKKPSTTAVQDACTYCPCIHEGKTKWALTNARHAQSHKSFRTKQKLAKAQKQNRPIPQWIRLRTNNTIRYELLPERLESRGWEIERSGRRGTPRLTAMCLIDTTPRGDIGARLASVSKQLAPYDNTQRTTHDPDGRFYAFSRLRFGWEECLRPDVVGRIWESA